MAKNQQGNVKPGRKKRGVFKPKSKITEVSRSEFEEARNDPGVTDFFQKAQEEGEALRAKGLIHR